jgi:anaerobic magnesium-protoporphyrin IX monomethyl ester cyclase
MDRNLVAIGFRRVVSYARQCGFDVQSVYFLDNAYQASFAGSWWRQKTGSDFKVNYVHNEEAIARLADMLCDADVVAFSLMSVQRNIAMKLCRRLKELNPKIMIFLGGYHPTIFPDDAITFADAICLGEGEKAFVDFLRRLQRKEPLAGLTNSWVKDDNQIIKSARVPIMQPDEMETMPFMEYGLKDQFIFSYAHGRLKPMEYKDVIRHLGTTYNTIWSVGCPFQCSFCSQAKFIKLDKAYAQYRAPSPDYIIREIKEAAKKFPIDYVIFYDSNFLGQSLDTLSEFAGRFKKELGLKFILSGTNPVSITEDKISVLLGAGLVRIKMGLESASDEMLKLFNRPVRAEGLRKAADTLARFGGKMVAPSFEMIVDNPYETTEQLYQTVDFLDAAPGPFTISLFSLQFMPGTTLSDQVQDYNLIDKDMEKEYMFSYKPTAINNLISVFAVTKPPHFFVRFLKSRIRGEENKLYPFLKGVLYKTMLLRRAFNQARFGDFSTFPYQVMTMYYHLRNNRLTRRQRADKNKS